MIELGRHIEVLLLDYECVIVPGLGGFVAHHIDARYDEHDGAFIPPFRTLGFNPHLKLNDSLLAQSYVEAYDISYPEAIQKISAEVEELKLCIQTDGYVELNDIGTIRLNEEGNYEFEPCEAGVLTPSLYGLSTFEMHKKQPKEAMTASSILCSDDNHFTSSNKVVNGKSTTKPTNHVLTYNATTDSKDEKFIKIKISWLRNAVACVAAIIAFFIITPPISNSYMKNANFYHINPNIFTFKEISKNDIRKIGLKVRDKVDTSFSNSKVIDESEHKAVKRDLLKEQDTVKPYCIVLASRITKKNAQVFIKELYKNGLKDAEIYSSNNVIRVVYGKYATEAEAYDTLRGIKDNKYFEQAWVYKKR